MKHKPINSGPINKNFRQPSEPDPLEEMLEAMKKKAEQIADGTEAAMNAIEVILRSGGSFSVPFVIMSPCQVDPMCGMQRGPNP